MNEALTLSWSRAQAAGRQQAYRRVLGINLALNVLIGLLALCFPAWLAGTLGQTGPEPAVWLRLWGVALLFTAVLYASGWLRPTEDRIINLTGIGERTVTGFVLLLAGVWILALYALAFAFVLLLTYYRLFQAELATRP